MSFHPFLFRCLILLFISIPCLAEEELGSFYIRKNTEPAKKVSSGKQEGPSELPSFEEYKSYEILLAGEKIYVKARLLSNKKVEMAEFKYLSNYYEELESGWVRVSDLLDSKEWNLAVIVTDPTYFSDDQGKNIFKSTYPSKGDLVFTPLKPNGMLCKIVTREETQPLWIDCKSLSQDASTIQNAKEFAKALYMLKLATERDGSTFTFSIEDVRKQLTLIEGDSKKIFHIGLEKIQADIKKYEAEEAESKKQMAIQETKFQQSLEKMTPEQRQQAEEDNQACAGDAATVRFIKSE